ncbi:ketoacyl-synt-domain-containing protein [Aaosphaeria arxii CBS 175.79]|uniref:Ketoacyl-synt-domain-containing protein n=1 Tax=Aaosphaeria arxii CBS 175.79 TaxID=1450172 RepID=A0A6A5XP82_9PLEO|nr:ketoacyl-synt-domain-containing protein [Aaosphaeria arxii CBS 175.79]KAF2014709.1 ketoacyl-synt-domain-containing protein [Aaosphaeria arxii CBS 175.79]
MEPIAVIGVGLRFPQDAVDSEAFWEMLMKKQCSTSEWPSDRLNVDAFHNPARRETSSIAARGAHFLRDDPALFDASFFSITSAEAAALDPQQCLLLETTYQAFENAGITLEALRGSKTGVYAGTMCNDHKHESLKDVDNIPKYAATGSSAAVLANRVSWFFDLAGPSLTLDTACSSSMIALHIACQGLMLNETSMAVVGGTNVLLAVEAPISMTRMGFLSPEARSYSFDNRANGYTRGEGVGVVVLKRLSDAIANNDTIRAVIRATGTNQDGYTPGITVPSPISQSRLIRETYEKAKLSPGSTKYFEAHGTGTFVGDPLEAASIGSVFRTHRSESDPIYVGTLKPNIGHLEGASGVAGLIKAILVTEKGILPPNANFERLNSSIAADNLNFLKFPTSPVSFPEEGIFRASVSSFGFGGSNAHAIVDDAFGYFREHGIVAHHSSSRQSGGIFTNGIHVPVIQEKILVWSANNEKALTKMNASFAKYFQSQDKARLSEHPEEDLAYTLASRRTHHDWRSYAIIESYDDLKDLTRIVSKPVKSKRGSGIAFVFTGQGAQYKGMGLHLLKYTVFHATLVRCNAAFASLGCKWSLFDVLQGDETMDIDHPSYSQPLCTALQIALVELLESFNIQPTHVTGHSSGEIAAAYTCGAISLESACRLAYFRGQYAGSLVDSTSNGSMLAVALSPSAVRPYLDQVNDQTQSLAIACINSPQNVTIGGPRSQILLLQTALDAKRIFCRELKTGVAYHTSQMEQIAGMYQEKIADLKPGTKDSQPTLMSSSVTGDWVSDREVLRESTYWVQNMVQSVRFADAMSTIFQEPSASGGKIEIAEVIEVGPHAALQRPITENLSSTHHVTRYTPVISRFDPTLRSVFELSGRLFSAGFPVRLDQVNSLDLSQEHKYKCLTNLPEYVFHHKEYAPRHTPPRIAKLRPHFPSPLLGAPTDWSAIERKWKRHLDIQQFPWLPDHKMNDVALFPASGMLAVAVEAVYHTAPQNSEIAGVRISNATFSNPIIIDTTPDIGGTQIETTLRSWSGVIGKESTYNEVSICVQQGQDWIQAFRCTIRAEYEESKLGLELNSNGHRRREKWQETYNSTAEACKHHVKTSQIYSHLSKMGMHYSSAFQGLDEVYWDRKQSAIGRISADKMKALSTDGAEHYFIHPAVLDSLFQLGWIIRSDGATNPIATSVPARIKSIWFSKEWLQGNNMKGQELRTCNKAVPHGFDGIDTSAIILDESGTVVAALDHLQTTMSARDHLEQDSSTSKRLCFGVETRPDSSLLESNQLLSVLQGSKTPRLDYMALLGHKNPEMKIFDITSDHTLLSNLLQHQETKSFEYGEYSCVNWTQSAREAVQKAFPDECASGRIGFVELELSSSAKTQGIASNSYDIALLSARSIKGSHTDQQLSFIRDMMKSGGKLLHTGLRPSWLLEASKDSWFGLYSKCKFSDECLLNDHELDDSDQASLLITTATADHEDAKGSAPFIIVIEDTEFQKLLARRLQTNMSSKWNIKATVTLLSQLPTTNVQANGRVIFLPETERAFLHGMKEADFASLKHLMNVGQELVWISKSNASQDAQPYQSMINGLARVLRSEYTSRDFTTISFDSSSTSNSIAEITLKILGASFASGQSMETEYFITDGIVRIPRVVHSETLDQTVFSKTTPHLTQQRIEDAGPLKLEIKNPGLFDTLRFVPLPEIPEPLLDDEVEVQALAFGLNFKDVVIALGRLPASALGCECSGVVTKVGRNSRFVPGDRVMMAQNGCFKTINRIHQDLAVKIPDILSFEEAAAIPIAGTTAYYSLVDRARLEKDETVLIHSGAGATGQMCIQVALSIGAKIYTTVGSLEKRDFLMEHYCIPKEQILYSRDTSFAHSIMVATEDKGVDVVVNSLSGDRLRASWEVIAPFGRFVELGRTEMIGNAKLAMAHFDKNVSFHAVATDDMGTLRPTMFNKFLSGIVNMIAERKANLPYPLEVMKLSEVEKGFRSLMSGKSTGKFVLKVEQGDIVKTWGVENNGKRLDANSTYVIAGGLGGLGRSAARWMVSKGARNLLLLSRSGHALPAATSLLQELRDKGAHIEAPPCDVTSEEQLAAVLAECAQTMPPIRGCLQGTMVLRDALFETMTYDDWNVSTQAKIATSINLDKLLPAGMDFFIFLSSLSGIVGTTGQANYAAGNTFQDALAQSRIDKGERAIAIDLGAMNKVGVIAENEHLGKVARNTMLPVEEEELLALLDHYCLLEDRVSGSPQTLVGLPTGSAEQSAEAQLPAAYAHSLFSHIRKLGRDESGNSSTAGTGNENEDYGRQFKAAGSLAEAAAIVMKGFVKKLSRTLSLTAEDIDTTKALHQYGVDSLVAVELRNWFGKEFASNVAVFNIVGAASILAVGDLVAKASTLRSKDDD